MPLHPVWEHSCLMGSRHQDHQPIQGKAATACNKLPQTSSVCPFTPPGTHRENCRTFSTEQTSLALISVTERKLTGTWPLHPSSEGSTNSSQDRCTSCHEAGGKGAESLLAPTPWALACTGTISCVPQCHLPPALLQNAPLCLCPLSSWLPRTAPGSKTRWPSYPCGCEHSMLLLTL